MVRTLIVLVLTAGVAHAQASPPSGYKCGAGKPVPGTGCTCPAGTVDKRNANNHAICAPAPKAATSPCRKAALVLRNILLRSPEINEEIDGARRAAFLAKAVELLDKRCVADRWAPATVTCFVRATKDDHVEACADKLTKQQSAAVEDGFDELARQFRKKEPAAPPPPKATAKDPPPDAKPKPVAVKNDDVRIMAQVYFEANKAKIKPMSFPQLDDVAAVLKSNPTIRIRIGGHTDSRGDDAANLALSTKRAEAVRTYLIERGIEAARLEAKGYGEYQPIASNTTEADRARNRRIEFTVLSR